jgi:hypothetical protein
MPIRDPGSSQPLIRDGKNRIGDHGLGIGDKHPRSATLNKRYPVPVYIGSVADPFSSNPDTVDSKHCILVIQGLQEKPTAPGGKTNKILQNF